MNAAIAFILGLSLGTSYSYWRLWQYRIQLRSIRESSYIDDRNLTSLPLIEQVSQTFAILSERDRQLEKQLQIWQDSLELAPIGYLLLDEENQLLWCNKYARTLLKIDEIRLEGKIRLLLELVRSYELDRLIEETRQTQQSQIREWVFYPTNYDLEETNTVGRKSIPIKGSSFPLSERRVVVFLENQQSLVELSRSRERTFSDLTHELRTPLTGIALVAEMLQKKLQDPERKLVERVLKEIDRLTNLIQDWLEITQIQENPLASLNYNCINLPELIQTVWDILETIASQKEITLEYLGPDRIDLQADRNRLTQVFLNLLDNAIKHSHPQAQITLGVKAISSKKVPDDRTLPFEWVQIDIIDSGSGFAPEDLPYIFDRLYRGDTSRTRQSSNSTTIPVFTSGSGLGLAITREIIKSHGGSIEACNHPETGGAWLKIVLPVKNYTFSDDLN